MGPIFWLLGVNILQYEKSIINKLQPHFLTKDKIPAWSLKIMLSVPHQFQFLSESQNGGIEIFTMKALPGGQSCHQVIYQAS